MPPGSAAGPPRTSPDPNLWTTRGKVEGAGAHDGETGADPLTATHSTPPEETWLGDYRKGGGPADRWMWSTWSRVGLLYTVFAGRLTSIQGPGLSLLGLQMW